MRNKYIKAFHKIKYNTSILIKRNIVFPIKKCCRPINNFDDFCFQCKKANAHICGWDYFDSRKKAVLLVSHELSQSGAPVALLNFAIVLSEFNYQPIIISPYDGLLKDSCNEKNIPVIVLSNAYFSDLIPISSGLFSKIIINTILGAPLVNLFNHTNTSVLWWIHESAAAYNELNVMYLPDKVSENIKIACVGEYAEKLLKFYRPRYQTSDLFYYLPDCTNNEAVINKNAKNVFICIGALVPRKGQKVLCESINLLTDKDRSDSKFVFCGKDSDSDIFEIINRTCQTYPDCVFYIGERNQNQISELYNSADCLICPSTDDPMPIVAAEAMMHKKIIICSDNTGTAKLLVNNKAGIVFESENANELCEAIKMVIYNKIDANIMAENGRKLFETQFMKNAFENNIKKLLFPGDLDSTIDKAYFKV